MAQFTLNIPDDKLNDIIEAFANEYNYQEFIIDISGNTVPNTVTKVQFAKKQVADYIKSIYKSNQIKINTATAIRNADDDSNNISIT